MTIEKVMKELARPVSSKGANTSHHPNRRAFRHLPALGAVLLCLCAGDWRDDSVVHRRSPSSAKAAETKTTINQPEGLERFGDPKSPPATQKLPETVENQAPSQPRSTIPFDNPSAEDAAYGEEY